MSHPAAVCPGRQRARAGSGAGSESRGRSQIRTILGVPADGFSLDRWRWPCGSRGAPWTSRAGDALIPCPRFHDHKTILAVLPFENLSGDPDQEFFSDGLTEEMIAEDWEAKSGSPDGRRPELDCQVQRKQADRKGDR